MANTHQATPDARFAALREVVKQRLGKRLPRSTTLAIFDAIREARRVDAFPDHAAEVIDATGLTTWAHLAQFRDALEAGQ